MARFLHVGAGRRSASQGFTLVEIALVAAVLAVLAALSFSGLERMQASSRHAAAVGELLTGLATTRAEAFGRGARTVFVVDTARGRWWGLEDAGVAFTLDTFDPNEPAPAPDRLLASGALADGSSFGPSAGWGAALPAPFHRFPVAAGPGVGFPFCSFCRASGPGAGFGAVVFGAGDGARFDAGPATPGQTLTVTDGSGTRRNAVAIVAYTGLHHVLSR